MQYQSLKICTGAIQSSAFYTLQIECGDPPLIPYAANSVVTLYGIKINTHQIILIKIILSELITTQLRDFHMVSPKVVFLNSYLPHHAKLQVLPKIILINTSNKITVKNITMHIGGTKLPTKRPLKPESPFTPLICFP